MWSIEKASTPFVLNQVQYNCNKTQNSIENQKKKETVVNQWQWTGSVPVETEIGNGQFIFRTDGTQSFFLFKEKKQRTTGEE